ncbi:MAG: hypothetical protein KKA42_01225 [candidate division Zixibacteria bacterium]|nr:hypothetical protein [candidate division Zixibacteria bacterium]
MRYVLRCVLVAALLICGTAYAQTEDMVEDTVMTAMAPAPATNVNAFDTDNDHGHSVTVTWDLSVDDGGGTGAVTGYEIHRWSPAEMVTLDSLRGLLSAVEAELPNVADSSAEANLRRDSLRLRYAALIATSVAVGDDLDTEMKARRAAVKEAFLAALDGLPAAHARYPENGNWQLLGKVAAGVSTYSDAGGKEPTASSFIPDYCGFHYKVHALTADETVYGETAPFGPVECYGQWFNTGRVPVLLAVLIFGALTIIFVSIARRGADLYVRPLAGIEAVDDAIGRATEMGRPILYVLGLGTAADVATIASFTILGRVAKRVAEYQTALIVPTYEPIVMTVAQEVVKSSYLDAGRPDDYKDDTVFFVTQSQFAYVAAVNGIMLRELPATCVYMGKFFAESLLLAETGALAGSIQIAGTDEIAQIPFFIVACDYTLIGEELYAASAYLGREPILLGSLKAQDYAKAAVVVFALAGLLASYASWGHVFTDLFKVTN